MAAIYCWLSVESIETGSSSSIIAYCGKEKECVAVAKSANIYSGPAREYILRNARWLKSKDGKFRVRITAGGEEYPKVERKFIIRLSR